MGQGWVDLVNRYVNKRIAFHTDQEAWGQPDYWASPLETLSQGQGDCEDYAIGKYFSLLVAGVPVTKLRLEARFSDALVAGLRAVGHDLELVGPWDELMGHAGVVVLHGKGTRAGLIEGAGDPRGGGRQPGL